MSSGSTSDDDLPATQSSQSSRTSLPNMKGRDLFDSMIWSNPFTTSIFYMFISSLRQKIQQEVTSTTATHEFIRVLRDGGRLVRNYTQNIDCLEERLGLCTELSRGPGNRSRFHTKHQRETRPSYVDERSPHHRGVEVVLLHGSLTDLRCNICGKLSSWKEDDREEATLAGQAPDCPSCTEYNAKRTGRGRRGLAIGRLRPDIVLYGEEHPHANLMGSLITHDISLSPDVLLIMGTSLKVHGLKVMVKEFAKAVHARGGQVIFVNRTKPSESTWGDLIDYWVEWDCDEWVIDLKRRRRDIWLPQGTVEERSAKEAIEDRKKEPVEASKKRQSTGSIKPDGKKPRLQCLRDDKMNGVFVTYKILDTLRRVLDSEGKTAARFSYFDKSKPRTSLPIPGPVKTKPAPKRKTKSMPPSGLLPVTQKPLKKRPSASKKGPAAEEAARQILLDANEASLAQTSWERFRRASIRKLPPTPPAELAAYHLSYKAKYSKEGFFLESTSNYLPSLYSRSDIKGMSLSTLPPKGGLHCSPKHTPEKIPKLTLPQTTASEITNLPSIRAYGTRLSGRSSAADTVIVNSGNSYTQTSCPPANNENNTIVATSERIEYSLPTPPASGPSSDPVTPELQQRKIKQRSSISSILSSPHDHVEVWHDAQEALELEPGSG